MRTAYTGGTAGRKFGVELEIVGLDTYRAAEAIRGAGVECHAEGYGHTTRSFWKVVTDASVPGGCEVVSPVLSGDAGLEQVRTVCNALVAAGARVNRTCGTHVHVNARDLDLRGFKNVAKLFIRHERAFDALVAPSRRGNLNRYCQSNLQRFAPGGGYYGFGPVETPEQEVAAVAAAFAKINAATSVDGVISAVNGGDRYFKLNLTSFYRHGTVEFRMHNGTVNAQKLTAWIELVVGLVSGATFRTMVMAPRKLSGLTASRRMRWLMDDAVATTNPARAFLARRASRLARLGERRAEAAA